jgi:hypothetical protein
MLQYSLVVVVVVVVGGGGVVVIVVYNAQTLGVFHLSLASQNDFTSGGLFQ